MTPIIRHEKVTQPLGGGNLKILKPIFQTHLIVFNRAAHSQTTPFNNNPQNFNNQLNLEGLVSNFMASQDAILSKFEADFKQQQSKMTNKIDTFLKAINDQMTGALPSDTVKNPKLNVNSTSSVLSAQKVGEELSGFEAVIGEGESRDIKRDNLDNRTCGDTKEVEEVEEESGESEEEEELGYHE
ncbi:hypothetical protein Tco_0870145 [Tanacetum coccineum]